MHPFDNAPCLRLDISRPKRSFEVLSCEGSESADRPYTFQLEILSSAGAMDAHDLLFSACYLHSKALSSGIHGHIQSIVRSPTERSTSDLSHRAPMRYLITVGPRLGLMAYRHNQRIFHDMCAEQIVTQVLSEHGIDDTAFFWHRKQPCRVRNYCAQYRESDLQLVQRLCEEEGMHYYFLHARSGHVVVFTDELSEGGAGEPLKVPARTSMPDQQEGAPPAVHRLCMQRACVVGRLFELARRDDKGRIKVRFEWSNQGDGARFNDCWIPVDAALTQHDQPLWGGMEVVVNFRDGNPHLPYISDRLCDPDINPGVCPDPSASSRRVVTTRIDRALFLDESQTLLIDDQLIMQVAGHHEMQFRVGNSLVTLDAKNVSLSGLKVMLSSMADVQSLGINVLNS